MFAKRYILILLSLILAWGVVLAARSVQASTPTLTPTSTPKTKPLDKIIKGAKAEGAAVVRLSTEYPTEASVQLRRRIKERFGVDLDIKMVLAGSPAQDIGKAVMAYKAGIPIGYDLGHYATSQFMTGTRAGIFETVDWKSLLGEDTSPELLQLPPISAVTTITNCKGLVYNPEKVPANEVPKTFRDMANPKWQGKVGIFEYPNTWGEWAFQVGKEKLLSDLRAVLKNKAIQGRWADLINRYMLGEIWMTFFQSSDMVTVQDKGKSAVWQTLDYLHVNDSGVAVMSRAKHPNAAKLIAVYLASPAGNQFSLEMARKGNYASPGNIEYDIVSKTRKEGKRIVFVSKDQKLLDFSASKEYAAWLKEIGLILQKGE